VKRKLVCISDLHGFYPDLPDGDILVIAGDFTASDTEKQNADFLDWVASQPHKDKIIVPGNHDMYIFKHQHETYEHIEKEGLGIRLLVDEACERQGLKFWGCPWIVGFPGLNPKCAAFTIWNDAQMMEKLMPMPEDIDVYIGHSPPYRILDIVPGDYNARVGSQAVFNAISHRNISWSIFGHIHGSRGEKRYGGLDYYNVSYVDDAYKPHKLPIQVIEVEAKKKI
jgi:Icc-related predicted phosphoesterase